MLSYLSITTIKVITKLTVIITVLTLCACEGKNNVSNQQNSSDGCSQDPAIPECRPINTSCIAPEINHNINANIVLHRQLPNVSFSRPVQALQAPADSTYWYIVEQGGTIKRIINSDTATSPETYLSLPITIGLIGEGGLLSMAFSPDWPDKKEIYVSYTLRDGALKSKLSRFSITDDTSLPISHSGEEIILTVNQLSDNHNGGYIAFGSDGYLYYGLGDGGSRVYPQDNAQNTTNLLGNMLRIDVNGVTYPSPGYLIPAANPFNNNTKCGPEANGENCPEIYAWGLRNPWRWSFDKQTNDLWLGDVGQQEWEEINILTLGGNFGWRCKEGTNNIITPGCTTNTLIDPIFEYPHTTGNVSITGGFVYRGTNMPSLAGKYLFADYLSGRVWALSGNTVSGFQSEELLDSNHLISSFAQSNDEELYLLSYIGGELYQIKEEGEPSNNNIPNPLSDTGCVSNVNIMIPDKGLIPYQLNAPFWSDNAEKERWIALPDNTLINPSTDNIWVFPNGTVTMKNFSIESKLVETRLFMRHPNGSWAGYSYEWDETETTATRVIGGKVRELTHTSNPQQWIYPSEGECLQCHTAAAGYVLGINTPQLNRTVAYSESSISANQLETFNHINLFTENVTEPVTTLSKMTDPGDVSENIFFRVKAYLHTNCASCHSPNGGTQATMDLRFDTPLNQMNICNANPLLSDLGITDAKLIAPGQPEKSLILNRINRRDANGMPPIGSTIIDTNGIQLLEQWISSLAGCSE